MDNAERYLFSAREAFLWLGIPVKTLSSWALAGKIPHFKVHKAVLFGKAELIQWLENHRRAPDGSPPGLEPVRIDGSSQG